MSQLPTEYRRLLLESAFAGINHGLHHQVEQILPALPILIPDSALRTLCMAVLLAGLKDTSRATELLGTCTHPDAGRVRAIFFPQTSQTDE